MRKTILPILLLLGNLLLFEADVFPQCIVSIGSNATICTGQSYTITATSTNGHPTNYAWTSVPPGLAGNGSGVIVSPSTSTSYILNTSGNGCITSDTVLITVTAPPASPSFTFSPNNVCSGSSVYFSVTSPVPGLTYTWNFGDSTSATDTDVVHAFSSYGTGTATFNVTLTASNAGCGSSSTQTVTVRQGPDALLTPGPGVDTMLFGGFPAFYVCAAAAQQNAFFAFINGAGFTAGYTYTIIWGDGSANYSVDTAWTIASHTYIRGFYDLTYIVNPNNGSCADTTNYRVFFGSNPAGGIASLGNTDICGPGWLSFLLTNFQSNAIGTIYTITFNDGTPPLTFSQPPPDSVSHYFSSSSCGVSSTDGVTVFNNSYAVSLTIKNPCGTTAAAVEPIYVSLPPMASYAPPGPACTGVNNLYVNTTKNGTEATSTSCDETSPILWQVIPATGWSITTGSLGSANGFTGGSFDPGLWTPGSNTLGINFTTPGNYQVMLIAANDCGPDTVIETTCVSALPAPAFTLAPGGDSVSGCAPLYDSIINMTPPAGGNCSGITYAWSINKVSSTCNPDSSKNFHILQGNFSDSSFIYAGFYNQGVYNVTLKATNVCGAVTSSPQTITVNTIPQLNLDNPAQICFGQPFSPQDNPLSCGAAISGYSWSFPGGTPASSNSANPGNITYPSAGLYSYSLSITNECGAADTNTYVLVDTIPAASAGSNATICSGDSVQIGSATVPGLTYSWSPQTGLSSPSVSNPKVTLTNTGFIPITQTYYLTVSNAIGCSSVDSVRVTAFPAATVSAGPDIGVCAGQTISLIGSFGGAATSVTWTSANGGIFSDYTSPTSSYTPSITSGTVVLTLTTNAPSGICPAVSSTTTITVVAPPVANAGSNISTCSGIPVQIGSGHQAGYTYLWSPSTGLSSTHIANPIATITNNTNAVINQTYTLQVSAVGCSDTAQATVSVYPPAGASAGGPVNVCANGAVALNGSISGAATSAVWSSQSGTFSQPDSLTTNFSPSISSGMATVMLISNKPSAACPADTSIVNVTVNPIPVVSGIPTSQLICSGANAQAIQLSSNIPGSTFNWTVSSVSNVIGYTTNGSGDSIPAQSLNDTSLNHGYIVYAIYAANQGCAGTTAMDTILVNPLFSLAPIPNQIICSGSTTQSVTPVADINGVSFSWTASADGNMGGYISSGTGSVPAQNITNAGSATDSVVFTLTGTAGGCSAAPVKFSIIVNPLPAANLPAGQTICSGTATTVVNLSSPVNGTTFSWTTEASSGLSGFADSGSGNIPSQTIYNADTVPGSLIYQITGTSNGCTGPAQFYIINVYPAPVAAAFPAIDSVCTGVQTNISLTSNLSGTSFSWTVNVPPGVNGASPGNGNSIQQILTNTGLNGAVVNYFVTPYTSTCNGMADTINVLVNPGTAINFSPGAQSICSGTATQFVNISSAATGATYSWFSESNGISGVLGDGFDSIPSQILVNNSGNSDTARYYVSISGGGCPGQTVEYDIAVQSSPSVILPGNQSICGGNATTPVLLSSNTPGVTFSWTASSTNGVIGFDSAGTSTIPAQVLSDTNVSGSGSVVYVVQAIAGTCQGPATDYTIGVSPILTANPVAPQSICSGDSTQTITPTSNNAGANYFWQGTAGQNIQGFAVSGTGSIPAQTLTNTGSSVDSVVYTITPIATGCNANPVTATIIVNPIPAVTIPAAQSVCNGQPTSAVVLNSNIAGTTFSWTAQAPAGLSGYDSSGTGNIPQQIIANSDSTTDTLNYIIVPSANGCVGQSAGYQVAVNAGLGTLINIAADTICTGVQTNIQLSSKAANTTFTWLVSAPSQISGAQGGTGNTIQQTLTNTGATAETVTYIISSSANTCSGLPDSVNIVVNPVLIPMVNLPNQVVCSGQSTQEVEITLPVNGANTTWSANANGVTGVVPSGTNIIPVQTLINNGPVSDTVVYTISPENTTCASQNVQYNIIVNPGLNTVLPAAQAICSGSTTDSVPLSSSVAGTVFNWIASSTGVTNYVVKGTSTSIPAQTLFNTTDTVATVQYLIVPANGVCSGQAVNYQIAVNPQPRVILPATQTICNGLSTAPVNLTSNLPGVTFNWISAEDSGITGATINGTGNIPSQTLHNSGVNLAGVTYIIIPSTASCTGANASYGIMVYPTPALMQLPAPQVICTGQTSEKVFLASATPGVNISWQATIPSGITGADSSGKGSIPAQTLYNNNVDSIPQSLSINYNIQISYADSVCAAGSANYSMQVMPKPQADFILSANKGCSPLNVNVIPSTLNYGIPDSLVFNWGDGTPDQAIYPNSGRPLWASLNHTFYNNSENSETFNVTMTAPGTCANLSATHPVTVLPGKISAFFTASPPTGCEPLAVTFHDESVGAGTLSWCFNYVADSCAGGGVVDTAGSVLTHTFNAGTYTVALYATNGLGCAQDTVYQVITVTPAPKAEFIAATGPCADKNVSFTQQATAPAGSFITAFQWSFGDGDSALIENPSHIYDTSGTFNVCLSVTSSFGCTNQVCNPVTIAPKPVAAFTFSDACINQQNGQFVSQTSGATSFQWNFGDGAMASVADPVHDYMLAGNYTVTLIASNNICNDTVTHPLTIYNKPDAAFSLSQTYSCGLPSTIQITNTSTGAYAYSWDFGNGTISEFANPAATYTAQGTYVITLVASNQSGCFDTAQQPVNIYPYPSVQSVNVTPAEGCQPLNVQFFVNATNASQFVWNFGDGSAQVTTDVAFTSHLYTDTGTFTVAIQLYSYTTCGDTIVLPDTVTVHANPTAGFDYQINENTEPENGTVQFINTSVNSTSYLWNFGDDDTSTAVNPSHLFPDINSFEVLLIAYNQYGCKDSVLKDIDVIKKSLYVPNAFAPEYSGPDNLVRVWMPAGMGLATYHAQVFDKWGELLWESTALTPDRQPAEGWDGSYQGKNCQQDVYVWKVQATFIDGTLWKGMSYPKEPERKTIGSVTLIR